MDSMKALKDSVEVIEAEQTPDDESPASPFKLLALPTELLIKFGVYYGRRNANHRHFILLAAPFAASKHIYSTFKDAYFSTIHFHLTIYAPIGSRTAYYGNGTFDNSKLYYENVRKLRLHVEVYGEEGVDAVLLRLTPILRACEKLAKVELVVHGETEDDEVVKPLIRGVADVLEGMGEGKDKVVQLRINRYGWLMALEESLR
ncbi:hypothetical protein LTR56_010048 [Elasticomyces elasticus]|nr:hypothetical protein LTR56_010048 [Elasticomyces elasticus]KAK3665008.1 hypothetical protein LTR22_004060 [Elasticomyces elasticus]KAK4931616.1 hypothetical protein LTR49_002008 [Elasticomyces elasticus]KAK5766775.1 hypothetical protein LTS12_003128 [Elasticomyces elasticus]